MLLLKALNSQGILGELGLARDYPEPGQCLLVNTIETRTTEDLKRYERSLAHILGKLFTMRPQIIFR